MLAAASTSMTTAIWYTMRATGVVALVLLTVTTVLGMLSASRVGPVAGPHSPRSTCTSGRRSSRWSSSACTS